MEPIIEKEAPNTNVNLKMNIMILSATKEEAMKAKAKIYDLKFGEVHIGYPGAKKLAKNVHGVVAYVKDDESLTKIATILAEYEKYSIKTILGPKSDQVSEYENKRWTQFDEEKSDDVKDHMKTTFEAAVDEIKKIFESIDDDNNGFLSPFELTLVSQKLGASMTKEEIN